MMGFFNFFNKFKLRRRLKSHEKGLGYSGDLRTFKARKLKLFFKSLGRFVFGSRIFKIFLMGLLLSVFVVVVRYFLFSQRFNLEVIEIEGNNVLEKQFVESKLNYLKGQNIFFIRGSRLKTEIEKFSPYIKEVKVEKDLPDRLIITLVEREPYLVWINFSGGYLIDSEAVVLEVCSDFENLELSDEDIDLLKGYGDLSGLEKETNNETEEGEEQEQGGEEVSGSESTEEELTYEEKLALMEERRNEVVSIVDHFWEENLLALEDRYKAYPPVYSYEKGSYTVRDEITRSIISSTKSGLEIEFFGEEPTKYLWESSYRFVIIFSQQRRIVFSTRREFSDQIDDLGVLLGELKREGRNFTYIDLSSEVIVYELDE